VISIYQHLSHMPRRQPSFRRRRVNRPIGSTDPFSSITFREKLVSGIRNPEMKQQSISSAPTPVADGANYFLIDLTSQISQGTSDSNRVGDHLHLESIDMMLMLINNQGTTANTYTNFRAFIFQFFGDSNTAPTISNLLLPSNLNSGNTQGTFSSYDIDHVGQLAVCWDSGPILTIGSNGLAVTGVPGAPMSHKHLRVRVPIGNCDRNIRYYAAGTQGPNHIYLLVTTDQAHVTTDPEMGYVVTMRFSDA
jgi:hypothetical protein